MYRFEQQEDLSEGIKRVATGQLDNAIEFLGSDSSDPDERIHEARKCMKRLRGLVRLVRSELGDEMYRLENACYRDAARQLAGARDAAALLEALDALMDYAGNRVPRNKFATIGQWLADRRASTHARLADQAQVRDRVLTDLRWARSRVEDWPIRHDGWEAIQRGLRRVYARGRNELEKTYQQDDDAVFHQWRKRVKYLWYHTQLLQSVWPPMMTAMADELDELSELLGQEHDMTLLRNTVMAELSRPIRASTLQALLELIDDRQGHLRERAQRLGRRLYVERPRTFVQRLQGYWQAWRAEIPPRTPSLLTGLQSTGASQPGTIAPELIADYGCQTGEGPLWHPMEQRLYWVDIPAGRLFRYEPATGHHEQCFQAPEAIGGFTVQADGSLLLFMARGAVGILRDGQLEYFIDSMVAEQDSRFNDVIADPAGRVFCGTMPGPDDRPARLYRLDPEGSINLVLDDVGLANGMGFAPDRRTFYFTDSARKRILAFDYDEGSGVLSSPRVFVDTSNEPGLPDGMTVDMDGCIWSARWDGGCLVRYSPAGKELQRIEFPARKVSCPTFAGEDRMDLYVTTAGGQDKDNEGPGAGCLFRLRVGVRGVPEFLSRVGPCGR